MQDLRSKACLALQNPNILVLILGPCSIHHTESFLTYAKQLQAVIDVVSPHLFIVLRSYIEKPRTTQSWKGLLYQPSLHHPPDLERGLFVARELFIQLAELGVPLCMEFVDPLSSYYFDDLVTWGAIGARTSASQIHRQLASLLPFPVGFKNTLDGNVDIPMQGMLSAASPHTFLGISQEGHIASVSSEGNPWTHLILRGSDTETNYDYISLQRSFSQQSTLYSTKSRIMVDCSHGNSKKNLSIQKKVFLTVLHEYKEHATPLLGMMLESFIKEGHQKPFSVDALDPELSITDPCLSWTCTVELIMKAHEVLALPAYSSSSL